MSSYPYIDNNYAACNFILVEDADAINPYIQKVISENNIKYEFHCNSFNEINNELAITKNCIYANEFIEEENN